MSVLAVILFGLCVTSVLAECGTCDKTQCSQEPSESDCEFGVIKDACNCCLQCAKGIGQTCGVGRNAAVGTCATGLICKLGSPRQPSRCDEDPNAGEKVAVQELPADVTHSDNIQDTHTPEETQPAQPTGSLTPSRNKDHVASDNQTSLGQRETTRVNQEQRPIRPQAGPTHNSRTPEKNAGGVASEQAADKASETEQDVPSVPAEERQAHSINILTRTTTTTTTQGPPQRIRGPAGANSRSRGDVPLARTSTTVAPEKKESEHQQEAGEQEHAVDGTEQAEEEHGHTQNTDAIKPRQDAETPQEENQNAEAQPNHNAEEEATHSHDDLGPHNHDDLGPHSHDDLGPHSHDASKPHSHSQDDASHTKTEVEEPEPVASEGQNRRSEGVSTQTTQENGSSNNSNANNQNRNQSSRSLLRRTRAQKEPTPRHEHEGSIKNLNVEDKNETYSHDNPDFDNRTNK